MFGNRTYTLTAECIAVTDDRMAAQAHYGAHVHGTSSRADGDFPAFSGAYKARSPAITAHNSTLDRIERSMNAERQEAGLEPIAFSVGDSQSCHGFNYIPTPDGTEVHLRHWGPAPACPAEATLNDILNSDVFAWREEFELQGPTSPLTSISVPLAHPRHDKFVARFKTIPAPTRMGGTQRLPYFPIKRAYPDLRRPDDGLGRHDPARSEGRAKSAAARRISMVTDRPTRDWAGRSTASKHHGPLHMEDWSRIGQFGDGRWGTEIGDWQVNPHSRAVTLAEQNEPEDRKVKPVGPVISQEPSLFSLLLNHPPGKNQISGRISEEGSG